MIGNCPNGSPISAVAVGMVPKSYEVTQLGDMGGASSGQIVVPQNGLIFGAFGTSNTNLAFGAPSSTMCNSNGGLCPDINGAFGGGMSSITKAKSKNGGLAIVIHHPSASVEGPFLGNSAG